MAIEFDAETHTYRVDGKALPSVTAILKPLVDFTGVPLDVLERARQWGTAVHKMVELDIQGQLDEAALDPNLCYMLVKWRALRPPAWTILETEYRIASAEHGYAGTLDMLARKPNGRLAVIDLKTGVFDASYVGPQTAAYANALNLPADGKISGPVERYCLHLPRNGEGRLFPLTNRADLAIFQSCLNIYRWTHN